MTETIFDKIVAGTIPSYKVWEDDNYLAFLTPFPNTPGVTVVIPKKNPGDYLFDLKDDEITGLMVAAKTVARQLGRAFQTPRVAMVIEGTGVAHVHVKLYPLHGKLANETGVHGTHVEFYPEYVGYLTAVEGPQMDESQLRKIQAQVVAAADQA